MSHLRNNEAGLSLVEIMVASGLAMGLALAIANVLKSAQDGAKRVETKANFNGMSSAVRAVSSQSNAVVNSMTALD